MGKGAPSLIFTGAGAPSGSARPFIRAAKGVHASGVAGSAASHAASKSEAIIAESCWAVCAGIRRDNSRRHSSASATSTSYTCFLLTAPRPSGSDSTAEGCVDLSFSAARLGLDLTRCCSTGRAESSTRGAALAPALLRKRRQSVF